ncbi:hypothetical protein C5167_029651 [Papaver somniferum]|uniref:uncharacterized protein LOC113337934 n=1 Tax=Papaver somniferum TaxID=3469 RepID=UPI000E700044|nr:uncharacterized protein LOC113337934 [Papaver somniferum]RZC90518.1 hypothetical protein C5167_029651 [Papaver somniferum]
MSSASSNNNCSSSNSCTDNDEELNEQLRTLLSLVPDVAQTDPVSILERTRDYLRRIHEETERLEKEMPSQPRHLENLNQRFVANSSSQRRLQILRVETEKIGGKKEFAVKILWKRLGLGAAAEVQRAIEFCDLNVKSSSIDVSSFLNPDEMQTTAFVKVTKEKNMTEKELCDLLLSRFPS